MNGRFTNLRKRFSAVLVASTYSFGLTTFGGTANAQEGDVERRIGEMQEQIRAHVYEGEELAQQGRMEAAQEHFKVAEAIEAELHAWIEQLESQQSEETNGQRVRLLEARIAELEGRENKQEGRRDRSHFINVIEHLEHAMMILNEHGNGELAMQIDNVANQMRERLRDSDVNRARERGEEEHPERRAARQQIEVLHAALPALREAERGDAVHMVELAILAREMGLEGRRDEEAQHVRQQQPNRDQLRRILGMAVELYQEFGAHDQAEGLAQAVRELWPPRDGEKERERPAEERDQPQRQTDREYLARQIEIMRLAVPAILEAGREDTAGLLEHAIHARELILEGHRGEEARHVIETAPSQGNVVEILTFASRLWNEFGHETKAEQIGRLAENMAGEMHQDRGQDDRDEGEHREPGHIDAAQREQHLNALEERLAELTRAVEQIQSELNRIRGEGGRIR